MNQNLLTKFESDKRAYIESVIHDELVEFSIEHNISDEELSEEDIREEARKFVNRGFKKQN